MTTCPSDRVRDMRTAVFFGVEMTAAEIAECIGGVTADAVRAALVGGVEPEVYAARVLAERTARRARDVATRTWARRTPMRLRKARQLARAGAV